MKNINFLDIEKLDNHSDKIKIGELTQKVIDLLKIDRKPCNIIMWPERLKHTEKHKVNFKTEEEYLDLVRNIPNIIKNPDYVGFRSSDNSLQYIKKINKYLLVAVRLRFEGDIGYRTAYPITESQLKDYIKKGRVKQFKY